MATRKKSGVVDSAALKKMSFIKGVTFLLGKMGEGADLSQNLTITKDDGTEIVMAFTLKKITLADGTRISLK